MSGPYRRNRPAERSPRGRPSESASAAAVADRSNCEGVGAGRGTQSPPRVAVLPNEEGRHPGRAPRPAARRLAGHQRWRGFRAPPHHWSDLGGEAAVPRASRWAMLAQTSNRTDVVSCARARPLRIAARDRSTPGVGGYAALGERSRRYIGVRTCLNVYPRRETAGLVNELRGRSRVSAAHLVGGRSRWPRQRQGTSLPTTEADGAGLVPGDRRSIRARGGPTVAGTWRPASGADRYAPGSRPARPSRRLYARFARGRTGSPRRGWTAGPEGSQRHVGHQKAHEQGLGSGGLELSSDWASSSLPHSAGTRR